jgi:hypothetical protein
MERKRLPASSAYRCGELRVFGKAVRYRGVAYLLPAILSELHTVVRNELVNVAVLVPFRLGMSNEDDQLRRQKRVSCGDTRLRSAESTCSRFSHSAGSSRRYTGNSGQWRGGRNYESLRLVGEMKELRREKDWAGRRNPKNAAAEEGRSCE